MRLNPRAIILLTENKIDALQALPLEELLDSETLTNYQRACAAPLEALSNNGALTVPVDMIDPVDLESILNPVVVSNGRIFSQETIEKLLARATGAGEFVCPETRDPLRRHCFGSTEPKQSFIRLPQIDAALSHFRALRDAARAPVAPAALGGVLGAGAAGAGVGVAVVPTAPEVVAKSSLDEAICALSTIEAVVNLELKVSGSKLRVIVKDAKPAVLSLLKPVLLAAFNHNPESEIIPGCPSYHVNNFGRCWGDLGAEIRTEFWFPIDKKISDDDVNRLMTALLRPLALPDAPLPPGAVFGSIRDLAPRDYKTAFPAIKMSILDAALCCTSFLQSVGEIAREKTFVLEDKVYTSSVAPGPARHSGLMFFGAAPAAAAPVSGPSASSVAVPSAPAAQSGSTLVSCPMPYSTTNYI